MDDDHERKKILESVDTERLFDKTSASIIEWNIDNIVSEAKRGKFKMCTVDRAPLRYVSLWLKFYESEEEKFQDQIFLWRGLHLWQPAGGERGRQ